MTIRPTHKELTRKIYQAIQAVSEGWIYILDPVVIACDAFELGYRVSDLQDLLIDALSKLSPKDYVGQKPREKSYEDRIRGSELFTFKAYSEMIGCNFYLKFALIDKFIWIVSLHEFESKGGKP